MTIIEALDLFSKIKGIEREKLFFSAEFEPIDEIIHDNITTPDTVRYMCARHYKDSGLGLKVKFFKDKKLRDELMELNRSIMGRDGDPFYGAPVILLVIASKQGLSMHDGAATIENMLLEATNQGLGSCWIHRAKEEIESEKGREILSFTGLNFDDYVGVGHVIIGYSEMDKYPERKINEGRVFYK